MRKMVTIPWEFVRKKIFYFLIRISLVLGPRAQ